MSDYLMLGLLLICMRYDEKVYYKVLDNTKNNCSVNKAQKNKAQRINFRKRCDTFTLRLHIVVSGV